MPKLKTGLTLKFDKWGKRHEKSPKKTWWPKAAKAKKLTEQEPYREDKMSKQFEGHDEFVVKVKNLLGEDATVEKRTDGYEVRYRVGWQSEYAQHYWEAGSGTIKFSWVSEFQNFLDDTFHRLKQDVKILQKEARDRN